MWALGAFAFIALVVIPVGLFFGYGAALAAFAALICPLAVYHVRNLKRLVDWTHLPVGSPIPRAVGLWDFVFSDLNRRTRSAYRQRQELAASLEQFRDASQAMPDGVIYLSADDSIEWVNHRAEEQFGLNAKTDLGAPVTNLVRDPAFVAHLNRGDYYQPLSINPPRRDRITLSLQVIPFGNGRKMILSRDVTQIERLENMRRDFVANVSHELRTPLTVVAGFLETMLDGVDDLDKADMTHFLGLAVEQAGRMRRLIEDLLSLSALETGAPEPTEDQIAVRGFLAEIVHEAELLSAGRHRISLQVEQDAILHGSAKELHSAFANLASNAVRYTPDGGEIRVGWHCDDQGGEFYVQDTGIGIDPEHLPRLTERFYRVDRSRSRETGGTGLGLAIVKHVLTRHQAELVIRSQPGKGSRFVVKLPARRVTRQVPALQS